MSDKEIDLFMAFPSPVQSYFEFGMGGSTVATAKSVSGRVYAVESDRAWIAKVSDIVGTSNPDHTLIQVDHVMEEFGGIIAGADDLTVFAKRPDLDAAKLQRTLDVQLYEPSL